jgi:predicted acetyltransferase
LTQTAFSVTFTESQLEERRKKMNPDQFWGFFIDNRLAAQLAILPMRIYIQGTPFAMGGIAHVASYPELRRQGLVGRLMVRGLEAMKQDGQTVSLLNPFSYSFYRKYGWEYFSEVKTYNLEMSGVPRFRDCEGYVLRKKAEDWETVNDVYDAYARRFNGMLIRNRAHWVDAVFPRKLGSLAVYHRKNHVPAGYLLYAIKEGFMKIHEFVYTDEESRRGLWQFVSHHDSAVNRVSFRAPIDDPFAFTLSEPAAGQEIHPDFMIRIVDAGSFLRQYRFLPAPEGETMTIGLSDEHAEWNRGVWEIARKQDGTTVVTKTVGSDFADVSCDIQSFSSMMTGRLRPTTLFKIGRLRGSEAAAVQWERSIPGSVPFLTDMF